MFTVDIKQQHNKQQQQPIENVIFTADFKAMTSKSAKGADDKIYICKINK